MAETIDKAKSEAFDGIKQKIDSHGGVLTVKMGILRDAYGAGALGPDNVVRIQDILKSKGIGWSPSVLPTISGRNVRLYTLVSRFEESLERYSGRISPADDIAIKKCFTCDSLYEETIEKIRDMLEWK